MIQRAALFLCVLGIVSGAQATMQETYAVGGSSLTFTGECGTDVYFASPFGNLNHDHSLGETDLFKGNAGFGAAVTNGYGIQENDFDLLSRSIMDGFSPGMGTGVEGTVSSYAMHKALTMTWGSTEPGETWSINSYSESDIELEIQVGDAPVNMSLNAVMTSELTGSTNINSVDFAAMIEILVSGEEDLLYEIDMFTGEENAATSMVLEANTTYVIEIATWAGYFCLGGVPDPEIGFPGFLKGGQALDFTSQVDYAIEFTAVPEPASLLLVAAGSMLLRRNRRG